MKKEVQVIFKHGKSKYLFIWIYLSRSRNEAIIKYLVEQGADISKICYFGEQPLGPKFYFLIYKVF